MPLTQECQLVVIQPLNLQLEQTLGQQLAGLLPQPNELWVIDLAQVDLIDSSGLVALVTSLKAARQSGCRLILCNLQAPVRLVFELTQLDTVFEIVENYDDVVITVSTNKSN